MLILLVSVKEAELLSIAVVLYRVGTGWDGQSQSHHS